LRLSQLPIVGLGQAERLDGVLVSWRGDEVGQVVFAVRGLDLVGNGDLSFGGSALVDELERELGLVSADGIPFDLVGLRKIPVVAVLWLGDLEGCDALAIVFCGGLGGIFYRMLPMQGGSELRRPSY
jgi:hypothetical protein